MPSTDHFRKLRCSKCGEDSIQVNRMHGAKFVCECVCGHTYLSSSLTASAYYQIYLRNKNAP